MIGVFNEAYASVYDVVYADKNNAAECDAITNSFERFGQGKISRILDLGCGTGRHAVELGARGFDVIGVDFSEAMLNRARLRPYTGRGGLEFVHGDIRTYRSRVAFDAVLMNFNVLGYMHSNDDLIAALTTPRAHLRSGGIFIADFWYGPAVVADPPGENTREFKNEDVRVIRHSSGRHLHNSQCCEISIKVTRLNGERVIDETLETHLVRYFFPLELELMLRVSGFRLMALTGFPDIDAPASARKWAAAMVATAV